MEDSKIVRENKISKRTEMIYQSRTAEEREKICIEKMLSVASIELDEKLIKSIQCINKKFGRFHTMDQLCDLEKLVMQCDGKREEAVVKAFCKEWERVSEYSKEVE